MQGRHSTSKSGDLWTGVSIRPAQVEADHLPSRRACDCRVCCVADVGHRHLVELRAAVQRSGSKTSDRGDAEFASRIIVYGLRFSRLQERYLWFEGLTEVLSRKDGAVGTGGEKAFWRGWMGVWERGGPRRGSAGALEKGESSSVGLEALGWDFAGTQGGFAGVCLAARFDGAQGLALELPACGEAVVFEQVCLGENVVVHLSNLDRAGAR